MDKTANSGDSNVKTNAGTVLEMCLNINKNLDEQIGGKMRTIREIFKDAFDETRQEGRQEGRNEAYESVAADMLRKNLPLSLIEEISKLSEPAIRNLAASLGLKVV